MVDPRIYRAGLALAAVAVIVFGFSLQNPPAADTTTLVPPAFGAPGLVQLDATYPGRTPGSAADVGLARKVERQLQNAGSGATGFAVRTVTQTVQSATGARRLETVIGSRSGASGGTIVVLADRDAPGPAGVSGTEVLIGLARALAGETLTHPLMLVSSGGGVGAAGADAVARMLAGAGQQIDAVIALGDMAAAHPRRPFVIPFAADAALAPPVLGLTAGQYVAAQTGLPATGSSLGAELAHLALPLTLTSQGPFIARGIPSVLVSLDGDRLPSAGEPIDQARPAQMFAATMQTLDALDVAPPVPAPSAYLVLSGKIVPLWAVRLLVLALILPVGIALVDGLARARRRGHSIVRWLVWVLAGAVPFLVATGVVVVAGLTGVIPSPPALVGAVPVPAEGLAVMIVAAIALLAGFAWLRARCIALAAMRIRVSARRPASTPPDDGAAVALGIVLCATALVIWALNPFAAVLLVPAVHAWPWLSRSEVRARRWPGPLLALVGLAPFAVLAGYYAHSLGLMSPLHFAWSTTLLVAGGGVPATLLVCWSVFLGCAAGVMIVAARASRAAADAAGDEPVVTVRGPIGYAGPGSLGGTESGLRRGPRGGRESALRR